MITTSPSQNHNDIAAAVAILDSFMGQKNFNDAETALIRGALITLNVNGWWMKDSNASNRYDPEGLFHFWPQTPSKGAHYVRYHKQTKQIMSVYMLPSAYRNRP